MMQLQQVMASLSYELGSTAALTDSTGATQQTYSYGPYGYTSASGNTTTNSYEYIGRETDASGLYYLRNRYYNPVTQTFMSEDPISSARKRQIRIRWE